MYENELIKGKCKTTNQTTTKSNKRWYRWGPGWWPGWTDWRWWREQVGSTFYKFSYLDLVLVRILNCDVNGSRKNLFIDFITFFSYLITILEVVCLLHNLVECNEPLFKRCSNFRRIWFWWGTNETNRIATQWSAWAGEIDCWVEWNVHWDVGYDRKPGIDQTWKYKLGIGHTL